MEEDSNAGHYETGCTLCGPEITQESQDIKVV